MAYKLKPPTEEDFSDRRLYKCFSMIFLKKLQKLNEEQYQCKEYIEDVLSSLEDNNFKAKELKEIKRKILNKSKINESILLMDCSKKKGRDAYFKKYNQKKKCLFCKEGISDKCHIVKRNFFTKKKRMDKHYKNFQNHISNIIFLCPNHHSLLDGRHGSRLNSIQMRRLISCRDILNKKLIGDMDRELKNIEKINFILSRLDEDITKVIKKEIKKALGKLG